MWDAAVGYLLVEDAMYALKALGSYDSMTRAYDMLDAAAKQITRKKGRNSKKRSAGHSERDTFGYLNSDDVLRSKEEIVDGFFEVLKQTGDIEGCIAGARNPAAVESERRSAYSSVTLSANKNVSVSGSAGSKELDDILDQIQEPAEKVDFSKAADNSIIDIKPPKTSSEVE